MEELPVTIGFMFRREFVPRGCRLPRTEWFRGQDSALIRTIPASQATPAFRVRFPAKFFCGAARDRLLPEIVLDLMRYDGSTWWPLFVWEADRAPFREISVGGLFRILAEEYDLFGFTPRTGDIVNDTGAIALARRLCHDDEETNLALARDRVRDNFLICDGRAYIRGGQPLYVNGWLNSQRRRYFSITNWGADRAIAPVVGLSFIHRSREWLPTFQSGDFWLATDRTSALAASGLNDEAAPRIEVLSLECVRDLRFELTLDAIFAGALEALERPARSWKPGRWGLVRELLTTDLAPGKDADLNRRRFAALTDLLGMGAPPPLEWLARCYHHMTMRHGLGLPLFDVSAFGYEACLSAEDESALAQLAM